MGFLSFIGDVVSSVTSAVVEGISNAVSWVKEKVVETMNWMADKAEILVDKIKDIWKVAKKWIAKAKPYIRPVVKAVATAAAGVATYFGRPDLAKKIFSWSDGVATVLEKAADWIINFEDTAFAKKLDAVIKWAIDAAKKLKKSSIVETEEEAKEQTFSENEYQEAQKRKTVFAKAATSELPDNVKKSVELADLINNFGIIRTDIQNILSDKNSIVDFEHYLRLRAAQKLINDAEVKLSEVADVNAINEDDIFLVKISSELLSENPTLSAEQVIRMDKIILIRHNKKITPFVFEEMVLAWEANREFLDAEWKIKNKEYASKQARVIMLKGAINLDEQEKIELLNLEENNKTDKEFLNKISEKELSMQNYVFAAEGLLQVLEKSEEELKAEDKDYLIELAPEVGQIIIDCAQNDKSWQDVSEHNKSLIIDFANVFADDCKNRLNRFNKHSIAIAL